MIRFILTFVMTFVLWILFNLSFNQLELVVGFFVALIVTAMSYKIVFHVGAGRFLNPMRWGAAVLYVLVFLWIEIKSHLDVTYRIITGNINPSMVEIPTSMKRDSGKTLLGNSITLTPGTLTVKIGNTLLVHWLNYNKKERPGYLFEKIGKVITE